MTTLQSASDIQVITAIYDILVKLESDVQLTRVAIKLSELTEKIVSYNDVPNSDKAVADIIRDLCEKDSEVKNAIIEELKNSSLTVDDDFLENAFNNLA